MGKLINEPIVLKPQPTLFDPRPFPTRFIWRGRQYQVQEIGGEWRTLGRWWEGEGERRYIRAITAQGLAMDLCQDMRTGQWSLYEVQD